MYKIYVIRQSRTHLNEWNSRLMVLLDFPSPVYSQVHLKYRISHNESAARVVP